MVVNELLRKLQAVIRRTAVGSALLLIACLVALAAAGFAIAALYQVLATAFPSQAAAAITAVILLVMAAVIALIGASVLKGAKSKTSSPSKGSGTPSEMALLEQLVSSGRWTPLAMALIAGFAFGISPEIRREAARLLRREAERR